MSLTKFIPLRHKLRLSYLLKKAELPPSEIKHPAVWVFLAADYGNLGDVAITYAQKKFLCENFPGHTVIECPISSTFANLKAVRKMVSREDIITTVGGGNMGDLYEDIELLR